MKNEQKYMPNIGNCDTCDYIFQCTRASTIKTSILKTLLGCPEKLVKQYYKDCKEENLNCYER